MLFLRQKLQFPQIGIALHLNQEFNSLLRGIAMMFDGNIILHQAPHLIFDLTNFPSGSALQRINIQSLVQRIVDYHLRIAKHVLDRCQIDQHQSILINQIRGLRPHVQQLHAAFFFYHKIKILILIAHLRQQDSIRELILHLPVNLLNPGSLLNLKVPKFAAGFRLQSDFQDTYLHAVPCLT